MSIFLHEIKRLFISRRQSFKLKEEKCRHNFRGENPEKQTRSDAQIGVKLESIVVMGFDCFLIRFYQSYSTTFATDFQCWRSARNRTKVIGLKNHMILRSDAEQREELIFWVKEAINLLLMKENFIRSGIKNLRIKKS